MFSPFPFQTQHSPPQTLQNRPLTSANARWTTSCPAACQVPVRPPPSSSLLCPSPSPSPSRCIPHSTASTTEAQEAAGLESLLSEPAQLVRTEARAFAPATVANLGPGFDFLGCAVDGLGDHVTAKVRGGEGPCRKQGLGAGRGSGRTAAWEGDITKYDSFAFYF